MTYHKSVLVHEVLEYLAPKPRGVYVDATFGGGGHTRAILKAEPTCSVIAFDWDAVALEKNGYPLQEEFPGRLTLLWSNFAQIDKKLKKEGIEHVDGILADFGTSQYQLTERAGFSFYQDSPLDMRMSPSHQKVTAQELVNKGSEEKLYEIFAYLGEERRARFFARLIIEERTKKPIQTTRQLAMLIERVAGSSARQKKIHPATKIFQGLRIYVNKELENIRSFLVASSRLLNPEGRLVCISFHSLEDRLVKEFFKNESCLTILTPKVVIASPEEIQLNSSSRSAKLRAAQMKNDGTK
jgi:16S rRNA (cytosine1402-N4)-methyltransferase